MQTAAQPCTFHVVFRRSRHSEQYKAHLRSPEWARIRKAALKRAGYRCQFCGLSLKKLRLIGRHLQVHHNTYENLGHEKPEDLTVLCSGTRGSCHTIADQQRRAANGSKRRASGRKGKRRRRRSQRERRLLWEIARVPLAFFAFAGVMKIASVVLPAAS